MAHYESQSEEDVSKDRGIPPVSSNDKSVFAIAAGITVAVAFLGYFVYSGFAAEAGQGISDLQAYAEDDYDRERIKPAPEALAMPEPAPQTMLPLPKSAPPEVVANTSKADEGMSEKELHKRRRSPLIVYDKIHSKNSVDDSAKRQQSNDALVESVLAAGADSGQSQDLDTLSARLQTTATQSAKATLLQEPDYLIAQGKMISAVIETAISSDLPGMVRAVVNETIYSENGATALLTKGSRVIGEYRAGMVRGQGRLFVIWNRIITPEGIDIEIQSPGTGPLGQSGHAGWIDTHFGERFGASILLSSLGAASSQSSNSSLGDQLGDNFNASAEIALSESIDVRPTLHKNQGESIGIFVAKDLNFRDAMALVKR